MNDGSIAGNTAAAIGYSASSYGGGVYVARSSGASFNQTGGTIYGYASSDANSNTVKSGNEILLNRGHAVFLPNDRDSRWKDGTSVGTLTARYYRDTWTTTGDWEQ